VTPGLPESIAARKRAELEQLDRLMNAALDYQTALRRELRSNTWRNGLSADSAWLDLLVAMNAVDGIDNALADHIDTAREEVARNEPGED
jgi:hypothetical protein